MALDRKPTLQPDIHPFDNMGSAAAEKATPAAAAKAPQPARPAPATPAAAPNTPRADDPLVSKTYRFRQSLVNRLESAAREKSYRDNANVDMSTIVRVAVEEYLNREQLAIQATD